MDHQEEDASLTSTIVKANIALLQFLTWRKQLHRVTKKVEVGTVGFVSRWWRMSLVGTGEPLWFSFLLGRHFYNFSSF